jgi:hypothetical protein
VNRARRRWYRVDSVARLRTLTRPWSASATVHWLARLGPASGTREGAERRQRGVHGDRGSGRAVARGHRAGRPCPGEIARVGHRGSRARPLQQTAGYTRAENEGSALASMLGIVGSHVKEGKRAIAYVERHCDSAIFSARRRERSPERSSRLTAPRRRKQSLVTCALAARWLSHKPVPSGVFPGILGCLRTSSNVLVSGRF